MQLISILKGKCPQCKEKNIFNSNGNSLLFRIPEMHDRCENCNFKFLKEPGFFFGAMFVSYALAVGEIITLFLISYFVLKLSVLFTFGVIAIFAILCSTLNFRLSRTIWIYLFYKKV